MYRILLAMYPLGLFGSFSMANEKAFSAASNFDMANIRSPELNCGVTINLISLKSICFRSPGCSLIAISWSKSLSELSPRQAAKSSKQISCMSTFLKHACQRKSSSIRELARESRARKSARNSALKADSTWSIAMPATKLSDPAKGARLVRASDKLIFAFSASPAKSNPENSGLVHHFSMTLDISAAFSSS